MHSHKQSTLNRAWYLSEGPLLILQRHMRVKYFVQGQTAMGRECNSVSECLASMHKALGSSPKEGGRKERKEQGVI